MSLGQIFEKYMFEKQFNPEANFFELFCVAYANIKRMQNTAPEPDI